jgi:hypothetical protein
MFEKAWTPGLVSGARAEPLRDFAILALIQRSPDNGSVRSGEQLLFIHCFVSS